MAVAKFLIEVTSPHKVLIFLVFGSSVKIDLHIQEEKTARESLETERAELLQHSESKMAELRTSLETELTSEAAAHAETKGQMAAMAKQNSMLSVQADASRAQLQANSISYQKRQSQFEQQKSALEVSSSSIANFVSYLMENRIYSELSCWQAYNKWLRIVEELFFSIIKKWND